MTARKPARRPATGRVRVPIQLLDHASGLPLPAYQSEGAAGLDLLAALSAQHPMVLAPGARALIPTGLRLALPRGYEAQVRPRSGLAHKHGVTVLNSPGTIDADYRGEIQVILVNLGQAPFEIRRGERIAQMVVQAVAQADLVQRDSLDETKRGAGGFGSTGRSTPTSAPAPAPAKKFVVPAGDRGTDEKRRKAPIKRTRKAR